MIIHEDRGMAIGLIDGAVTSNTPQHKAYAIIKTNRHMSLPWKKWLLKEWELENRCKPSTTSVVTVK